MLVSIDGVAPRFVTPERMPRLCGLVRNGAGCFTARTVDPPWTRPVHASMLRGVDPATHGLIDNSMAEIMTDVPSVLAAARAAGLTTASANNWKQIDSLIEPDAATHRHFIDSGYDPAEDELMIDTVASMLRWTQPDMMFVYLCRPDLAGHEFGWGSAEYLAALSHTDATFGRLVDALDGSDLAGDGVDVVVTTDHGGLGKNHGAVVDDVMETFVAIRSPRVATGSMLVGATVLDVAPTVADLAGLSPDPGWQGSSLIGRERPMVDHLVELLAESEDHTYGEHVTMLAHALQTAANATVDGADDDLVLAALLHDVGHLVGRAGAHGDPDHAELGARFLRPWLPATITEPIRLHVAAKRYLVASNTDDATRLSEASQITLRQQGGAFDDSECAEFEAEPHASRAVQLRRHDDEGKRNDVEPAPLEAYVERLRLALATGPVDPVWARDACRCQQCRDGASDQHLLDTRDLLRWTVLGTRREHSALGDRTLGVDLVRGGDTHRAFILDAPPASGDRRVLWGSGFDVVGRRRDAADVAAIAEDVVVDGLAYVGGIQPDSGEVLHFAERLGFVRETNYGRLFDVRAEPDANNLAYTPIALPLHTDNPYRDPTPTVQVLLCLRPAAAGGATVLSDGLAAAEWLRANDPLAFEILANTSVTFRFHDADVDLSCSRTVIDVGADATVRGVALNHRSLATPSSTTFAGALHALVERLESTAVELTLAAGEAIVFDNRRILHSRTGFDASSGRHLQGCYIDIDALHSTARRARSLVQVKA
ncbi:MAG: TauD/TfdA family dioxygenase [Ilumatobacteraceae bacterium]